MNDELNPYESPKTELSSPLVVKEGLEIPSVRIQVIYVIVVWLGGIFPPAGFVASLVGLIYYVRLKQTYPLETHRFKVLYIGDSGSGLLGFALIVLLAMPAIH